jgi:hypothetical protein
MLGAAEQSQAARGALERSAARSPELAGHLALRAMAGFGHGLTRSRPFRVARGTRIERVRLRLRSAPRQTRPAAGHWRCWARLEAHGTRVHGKDSPHRTLRSCTGSPARTVVWFAAMRLRAALPTVAAVVVLAGGCRPRVPPPDLALDPARLLAQVQQVAASIQRVQGEARLEVRSARGTGGVRQFAAAERPDRVHLEELDFFGNPAAVLVTSGGRFWLYDSRARTLYRGAATPANLSRIVPVPISAEDLVSVLLGTAPILEGGVPVTAAPDHARLRLELRREDILEELWIGEKALVEKAERKVAGGAGPGSWEVEFSAHRERGGGWFPGLVSLRSAPAHVEVGLTWTEVEVNGELDPRLFEPPAPKGARVVDVGEGGEGW